MLIYVARFDDSLQNNLVFVDEQILKNAKQEKVLGVALDNKLNFVTHLQVSLKKSTRNALSIDASLVIHDYWQKKPDIKESSRMRMKIDLQIGLQILE